MRTNHRSAVAIIKDREVLLIHRKKGNEEYYIFPGGGVESGEKPKEAAIREIKEELSININKSNLYFWASFENRGETEHYYITEKYSGELNLIGDDVLNGEKREDEQIHDQLEWVDLDSVPNINLVPNKIKELLIYKSVIF